METSEADDFNESDHPRDENGRFTDGGGAVLEVQKKAVLRVRSLLKERMLRAKVLLHLRT